MKPTYLSIDLDYWNLDKTPLQAKQLFRKLFSTGIPLVLVRDHDALLDFANRSKATKLINVDYHSDFANYTEEDYGDAIPNCGTWIDFVKRLEEFEWRYPSHNKCFKKCEGRCECSWYGAAAAFWRTQISRRGHRVRHSRGIKYLPYSAVIAAGVSVSPEYWENEEVLQEILRFLELNKKRFKHIERVVEFRWEDMT